MQIPESVRIAGFDYDVSIAEATDLDIKNQGTLNTLAGTITLLECTPKEMMCTFLHECFHAKLFALGYSADEHDEKLINGLSRQLFQLVQDNPEMFERVDDGDDDGTI